MGGRISYDKDDHAKAKREGRAMISLGFNRSYVKDAEGKLVGGSTITYQGVAGDDFCQDITNLMVKYESDGGSAQFAEKLEGQLLDALGSTISPAQWAKAREVLERFSILPNTKAKKK